MYFLFCFMLNNSLTYNNFIKSSVDKNILQFVRIAQKRKSFEKKIREKNIQKNQKARILNVLISNRRKEIVAGRKSREKL